MICDPRTLVVKETKPFVVRVSEGKPGLPGHTPELSWDGTRLVIDGEAGPNLAGSDGDDGKSAFELAQLDGFTGTVTEWLESLRGADGAPGADGRDGADGADGLDGAPGADGRDGVDGEPGADGADGHTPVLGWQGNALTVDGVPGPDLTGPQGSPGAKGDPGDTGLWTIRGAGRPDVPGSMTSETAASVAAATSGAEFVSTDGAGVGAWRWAKHGTSWVVIDGDTGWCDITSGIQVGHTVTGFVSVQRTGHLVEWSIEGWSAADGSALMQLPNGFRPPQWKTIPIISNGAVVGNVIIQDGGGIIHNVAGQNFMRGSATFNTAQPWPLVKPS